MNKSLMAMAALTAMAAAASAQTSAVTIYGKIDQGFVKDIGSKTRDIAEGSSSRLGFRGIEKLGGDHAATFQFEHRFAPDTGAQNGAVFWNGISTVGIRGPWGHVNIGRQYVAAFSLIQNQLDPWTGTTVAEVRALGVRPGGVSKTRVADSIRYDGSFGPFRVAASIAEASQPGANAGPDRPFSIAANYSSGPLFMGAGYEDPANANDELWTVGARYALGPATLSAGYSTGTRTNGSKVKSFLVGLNYALGEGELKFGIAQEKRAGTTFGQKVGLGYHHRLSKRTKLYVDVGHDSKAVSDKTGYDVGLQHNF